MKILLLTLTIVLSFFQIAISQIDRSEVLRNIPLKKHFEPTNYNGGIQSWCFDQDSTGILYVANNEGLLEFDGRKWHKHVVPLSTRLRAVKVDNQNRIFVGGQGQIGYFTKGKNGLFFTSLLDHLPNDKQDVAETWKILEFNKKIFFNTEGELFVFDNNILREMTLPGYMRFAFNVENRFFAQFLRQGLYEFVNNEFVHIKGTNIEDDIIAILPKSDGYYYFTRSGQIYELKDSGFVLVDIPVKLGTINSVLKLHSGDFVIGTQNKGLYFFTADLLFKQHLTKNKGLSDRTITSLYEDEFNNLWISLNNGIDYLELRLPFSLINEEVGVEGTGYAAYKYNDQIHLGTNNGVFIQKETGSNLQRYPFQLLTGSEGQVYNFSEVENRLILNHHRGAFELNGTQISQLEDVGSWKFMQTSKPGMILGGNYQGMSFFENKNDRWSRINNISGLNESSRILEFENDSTLWMTHGSKGAYRIQFDANMSKQKKIEHFGVNNGLPSNIKISVYSLNGKLIFTGENGIYDFHPDSLTFSPNSYFNKLLGTDHVSKIVSNGNNSIYYIQNQKVGFLNQESFGTFKKETNIFNHINKFLNDDLPNISIIDDHKILIGAKEGFIQYDQKKEPPINKDFHVFIRSVDVGSPTDSTITNNPSFIINSEIEEKHTIKFSYAAPYFDGFLDLKYSYRLLPINENWSKWTSSGEQEYTHLPFGDYTFEVKALNIYELESSISTFSFKVLTPWYASDSAIISYFIFGLFSFLSVPLVQRKRHKKEKNILYRNKEQALEMKDQQINNLTTEKLQSELNLKNDQLNSTTMQLMKNNEFIHDIQNKIEASFDKSSSNQELKKIINTIEKQLSNDDSWDQFAYHFDEIHGNYLEKLSESNIKLSPREMKLAAFLRMNMSSKEISTLLSITIRSVELARYRLRKKLKLKRDQNLVEYLTGLDKENIVN